MELTPTSPFTVFELQNPSHDVPELYIIRGSTDPSVNVFFYLSLLTVNIGISSSASDFYAFNKSSGHIRYN